MTVAVNDESLLGDFLPNVYISRVIVSHGNKASRFRGVNPHIDIPTLEEYVSSFTGKNLAGVSLEEIRQSYWKNYSGLRGAEGKIKDFNEFAEPSSFDEDTKTPVFSGPTTFSDRPLIIRLDLVIKDVIENKLLSQWFNNDKINKFLELTIIQAPDLETMKTINNRYPINLDKLVDKEHIKTMNLFDLLGDENLMSNYESSTNDQGQRIYNITFSIDYVITKPNIQNLGYFAFVKINKKAFENSFTPPIELGNEITNLKLLNGSIIFEPVFLGGKIMSEATYYTDENDVLWLGNVFTGLNADGTATFRKSLPANPTDRTDPRPGEALTQKQVVNTKIQDFRIRDTINKTILDFSAPQKLYSSKDITKEDFFRFKAAQFTGTFAKHIFATRNTKNEVIMTFGFDLQTMFLSLSPYGKLWENLTEYQKYKLLTSDLFKNMMLIRKRVKGLHDNTIFDENQPIERLAELGKFSTANTGQLFQLSLDFAVDDNRYKHFSAKDFGISTDTAGYYQYGIRFSFEDKLRKLILGKLGFLASSLKKAKEIQNVSRELRYYNAVSDVFTKLFSTNLLSEYTKAFMPLLADFGELHDLLLGKKEAAESSKVIISLINMSSPKTGTPSGMEYVINLIQEFINNANTVFLGSAKSNNTSDATNTYSPSGVKSSKKTKVIFVEHYFNEIFDAKARNRGCHFLPLPLSEGGIKDKVGIKNVFYDFFEERVNQETLKYFPDPSIDVTIYDSVIGNNPTTVSLVDDKYTYLTPSIVQTPENGIFISLDQGSSFINFKEANNVYLEIAKKNLSGLDAGLVLNRKQLTNLDKIDKKQKSQLIEIIALKGARFDTSATEGVSLYSLIPPLKQNLNYSETGAPELYPVIEQNDEPLLTPEMVDEPNYNDSLYFLAGIDKVLPHTVSGKENKTISALHSSFGQGKAFYNTLKTAPPPPVFIPGLPGVSLAQAARLLGLPNQLKQLNILINSKKTGKAGLNSVVNNVDLTNFIEDMWTPFKEYGMYVNYFNIVKITYLAGYYNSNPVWTPMTAETFSEIKSSKKAVLCKMEQYSNEALGIYRKASTELPIFDQYFILSDSVSPFKKFAGKVDKAAQMGTMAKQMNAQETIPSEYLNVGGTETFFEQLEGGDLKAEKLSSDPSKKKTKTRKKKTKAGKKNTTSNALGGLTLKNL